MERLAHRAIGGDKAFASYHSQTMKSTALDTELPQVWPVNHWH
jgi:hypothetical protein